MTLELGNLIVGDSIDRSVAVPGYSSSDGWTLHYRLIPRVSGSAIQLDSTADSGEHLFTVTAVAAALWTAGIYSWAAWVTNADLESISLATGVSTLRPNPRTSTAPLDLRSDARIALEAAETALATPWTGSGVVRSYTIGQRSMTFANAEEAHAWINAQIAYWKAKVQREDRAARMAAGFKDPRKTIMRIGRV